MRISDHHRDRIRQQLGVLYHERAGSVLLRIDELAREFSGSRALRGRLWSERDVVLITYPDQVRGDDGSPLCNLRRFLDDYGLTRLVNTVHLLPFFPYSSDDGFSVIDYRQVDPEIGTWNDVAALSSQHNLMFDLVLNHTSSAGSWFRDYLAGRAPYDRYFIDRFADADLSQVTRPLLSEFDTSRGERKVWTTFSPDQVDLDYSNPDVLTTVDLQPGSHRGRKKTLPAAGERPGRTPWRRRPPGPPGRDIHHPGRD